MRTPLTPFLAADVPASAVASAALRFAYAVVFLGQVALAAIAGAALAWALPSSPRPNDGVAGVLIAFAFVHLPLGAALAWSASRSPGKGAALAGAITAAVLLSVPAWFVSLLLVSAQRTPFLAGGLALVAIGYGLGFAFVPRWVRAAVTPVEAPAPVGEGEEAPPSPSADPEPQPGGDA